MSTLITRPDLCRRWNKSARTLDRWQRQPPAGFPLPIDINGRWHFRIAEVERFERELAGSPMREAA